MKIVGNIVEVLVSTSFSGKFITRTARIDEVLAGGAVKLSFKSGGGISIDAFEAAQLGVEVEIPPKVMWVSNGDPSVAIRAEPPAVHAGEWTKYEEVRD